MDASAWIALGALTVGVVAQAIVIAFMLGGLFRDVKTLREHPVTDCKAELATLNAKFTFLETTLADLAQDMKGLLTGSTPVRRRTNAQ